MTLQTFVKVLCNTDVIGSVFEALQDVDEIGHHDDPNRRKNPSVHREKKEFGVFDLLVLRLTLSCQL